MKLTRTEIAEKYDLHKGKLRSIITLQPELKFPRPVDKRGLHLLYDADAVAKFFESNPHNKITWVSAATIAKNPTLQLDKTMALQFIRGMYAPESMQLDNAKRLIRARRRAEYSGQSRKTVRIRECVL